MSLQPGSSPYPVVGAARPAAGPRWNTAAAAAVGVLVMAYIVASIVQIQLQRQGVADANALGAAEAPGSGSSAAVEAANATMHAYIATTRTANLFYDLSFWAMFIAFFGWNAILRSRLRGLGRQFNRRSSSAWRVWQIGVIVSVAMILFVESAGAPDTADGLASLYQRLTAYYGVRAAVGVVYLWVVYSVWRSTGPLLVPRPATPPGYLPPAQPYPQGAYPPASEGFTVPASRYEPPAPPHGPSPWPGSAPTYPASAPPAGEVPPS